MIKALIFDFDGVLADTYKFNKNLSEKVTKNKITEEIFKSHHDGNVFEKPKINFAKESANKFHEEYFNNINNINSFLNLKEIKNLNEKFNLFIISSSKEESINKFLKYHKINYFEEVFGKNFHNSKVEKFKHLFKKYNLKSKNCLFITDTLGDIKEANEVNIKTIAVDFGFHDKQRLKKGNPFKIISSFKELFEILN